MEKWEFIRTCMSRGGKLKHKIVRTSLFQEILFKFSVFLVGFDLCSLVANLIVFGWKQVLTTHTWPGACNHIWCFDLAMAGRELLERFTSQTNKVLWWILGTSKVLNMNTQGEQSTLLGQQSASKTDQVECKLHCKTDGWIGSLLPTSSNYWRPLLVDHVLVHTLTREKMSKQSDFFLHENDSRLECSVGRSGSVRNADGKEWMAGASRWKANIRLCFNCTGPSQGPCATVIIIIIMDTQFAC